MVKKCAFISNQSDNFLYQWLFQNWFSCKADFSTKYHWIDKNVLIFKMCKNCKKNYIEKGSKSSKIYQMGAVFTLLSCRYLPADPEYHI